MSGFFKTGLPWAAMLALGGLLALAGCDDAPEATDAGFDAGDRVLDGGVDAGEPDTGPARVDAGQVCSPGSTLGNFCQFDSQCTDFCFCNGNEVCLGGVCAEGRDACDDRVACTVDSCDEELRSCDNVADDALCDDGNSCSGVEACDPEVGCLPGIPINCSDGDSCTLDSCDPTETNPDLACRNTLRDLDGDGYASISCEGGLDCDDDPLTGAMINPDAEEICTDGIDNNCDGVADLFDTENCRPENDTCLTPRVLTNSGVYAFSTIGLTDSTALNCERSGEQRDAVFEFTITADERDVRIELLSGPPSSSMELREPTCDDEAAPAVACQANTSSFSTANLLIEERLTTGTYYLIVSTPDETFLTLDFRVNTPTPPPREDICDANTSVITATTAVAGDFTILNDDYPTIPCGDDSSAQNEAVYRLSLSEPTNVTITANGSSFTGAQRDVRVTVVRDCADPVGTSFACTNVDGTTPSGSDIIRLDGFPAGDYWIMIEPDETFLTTEQYSIAVDLVVPPPRIDGDLCSTAQEITTAAVDYDVSLLRNDGGVGCTPASASTPYRDGYWSFEVTAESDVTVTTTGPFHLLSLQTDCADFTTDLACQASTAGGIGTITQRLMPGTYFVTAAIPSNVGNIEAEVSITPVPPPAP